jgi:hypothetical protein
MIKPFLTISLFTIVFSVTAQIEKIDTDRPDQTESPFIVPKKWLQAEMGFLQQTDTYYSKYRDIFYQHPGLLTKYGLARCVELRLITDAGTIKEEAINSNTIKSGITNVQLGGKVNFVDQKGIRPKTSLIAHYSFNGLRTLYKDSINGANFRITMSHSLSNLLSISYNVGMDWDRFGDPPAYIYTLSPGFNISEKWYAYIELFGFIWKNESPENSIDGGLAYFINDNFKIDVSAGFGLNKAAPDNYFSVGASFRFNTSK